MWDDFNWAEQDNSNSLQISKSLNVLKITTNYFLRDLLSARVPSGSAFCPASLLPHASMCNWRGSPLQLRAMGKQLKKYFVAGLEPKGFNYDSPLGTVFLVRSAGSDSGLDLGATSCKQTETETGGVRETLLLSPRCTVASRINKLVAQELLQSFNIVSPNETKWKRWK